MIIEQEPSRAGAERPQAVRRTRLRGRIRIVETWYDEDPVSLEGCDLWISHQRSQPVAQRRWLYFYSPFVDLTPSPESILANMRKNVSREIRQVEEKETWTCRFFTSPTNQDLENFAYFYDANPRSRDQLPMSRGRLKEFLEAGLVHLACVLDADGRALTWHCLLNHARSRIVQVYAMASPYHNTEDKAWANTLGRASRWLFYREFLHYKAQGCQAYDLNGWYAGVSDEKRLQINTFKEGFRGRIKYGFDCEEPVTLRGWIYMLLRVARRRLFEPEKEKDVRRRRQKAPLLAESLES